MANVCMFIMDSMALKFIQAVFDFSFDFGSAASVLNFCTVLIKLGSETVISELLDRDQVSGHSRCIQDIFE
jgi:hypothetical protein